MVDGDSESGSGSKPMSMCESHGGRRRFRVELRPGETTIVSWKKFSKEKNSGKPNGSGPIPAGPSSVVHQQPPPPLPLALASSKEMVESEVNEGQAGTNRLSTVIEKIERMYAGDGSSEDDDVFLDDVPDDDKYDTEDSFIDDAELDDYFQVDNSSIKHDGFFVNRGKLERIEPATPVKQQPKKRRRKDGLKTQGGNDDGQNPNKHMKTENKGRKPSSSIERTSTNQLVRHSPNALEASQVNAAEVSIKKKTADTQTVMDPSEPMKYKNTDQPKIGVFSSQNHNHKLKDSGELQDTSVQRLSSCASKPHHEKLNNTNDLDQSVQQKEKSGLVERFDLNVPPSRDLPQMMTIPPIPRKEGSIVRPKITTLDKAIRELEKIVAESRPPSTEVQDPDNSSQGVKRRLSPEIRQKLSKVARLAQIINGKIPKDVINRLMSILGHLMQLRTLKRNLRVMANSGLSARLEKDDRLQKTIQEVSEMVKQRLQYMKSKVQQQTINSDDFQEISLEEKEALKRKYSMDDALENKICDLYDLYVERLEEDAGPPLRKLYEELTALWPGGIMDIDGIKRAIRKAKDRRKALGVQRRDQEKIKRKKVLAQKMEDTTRREATIVNPAFHIHQKLVSDDTQDHVSPLMTKLALSASVFQPEPYIPVPVASVPIMDKPKQERLKTNPNSNSIDAKLVELLPKKKKKKQNPEAFEGSIRFEKVMETEERNKHHKNVAVPLNHQNPS